MGGENFNLKWNDHSSSLIASASLLFSTNQLTDVTIGTADKTFKAHKLVLSICSSSFAALFDATGPLASQHNPYIYMQDIPSNHIELLLKYMYQGEVSVEDNQLVHLIASAKGLGIKGLCDVDNKEDKPPRTPPKKKLKKCPEMAPPAAIELDHFEAAVVEVENDEIIEVEPKLHGDHLMETYDDIVEEEEDDMIPDNWYTDNPEDHMNNLGEDHMDDSGTATSDQLPCPYCPKLFASNWHLKRHVLTHTRENRFKCDVCNKDFSRNDNLKSHLKTIHGVIVPPKPKSSS